MRHTRNCRRLRSLSQSLSDPAPRFLNWKRSARRPDYTQAYLNAVMQKYLDVKKVCAPTKAAMSTTAITEQLIQIEKDLRNGEDEMLEFQKEHNIGFIQEEGNSAAAYLVKLNQEYARLKTEYDLLSLLDLDQNLIASRRRPDLPRP